MELWEEKKIPHFLKGEERPVLTPFLVNAKSPVGAIIVLPGGGYGRRAAHEGAPVAQWLNRLGIAAFVLDYRVFPYKHPAPLLDVQRAIRLVRYHAEEWGIDPDRVGVLGFSAGGHLAALSGTHFDLEVQKGQNVDAADQISSRPDAMILCYPVVTFQLPHAHEGSVKNLAGEAPSMGLLEQLSVEMQVKPDTPPTFIWHTANDASVPVENVLLLASALSKKAIPFDLHIFEKGRHGLGLANDDSHVRSWQDQCALWLKKQQFM